MGGRNYLSDGKSPIFGSGLGNRLLVTLPRPVTSDAGVLPACDIPPQGDKLKKRSSACRFRGSFSAGLVHGNREVRMVESTAKLKFPRWVAGCLGVVQSRSLLIGRNTLTSTCPMQCCKTSVAWLVLPSVIFIFCFGASVNPAASGCPKFV